MKIRSLLSTSAVVALLGATSAFASPIVFDFSPGPGENVLGTSQLFTSGLYSLTAYGFTNPANSPTELYQKYTSGNPAETGLGIAADGPDHEIPGRFYVQLDVQSLIDAGFTSMTFKLGSLQGGEQAIISGDTTWGSYGDGSLLSTLTGEPVEQWVTLALTTRFFNITGDGPNTGGADPVLESVTVNIPDSGSTLILLGASLLGFATLRKFRSSKSNA